MWPMTARPTERDRPRPDGKHPASDAPRGMDRGLMVATPGLRFCRRKSGHGSRRFRVTGHAMAEWAIAAGAGHRRGWVASGDGPPRTLVIYCPTASGDDPVPVDELDLLIRIEQVPVLVSEENLECDVVGLSEIEGRLRALGPNHTCGLDVAQLEVRAYPGQRRFGPASLRGRQERDTGRNEPTHHARSYQGSSFFEASYN